MQEAVITHGNRTLTPHIFHIEGQDKISQLSSLLEKHGQIQCCRPHWFQSNAAVLNQSQVNERNAISALLASSLERPLWDHNITARDSSLRSSQNSITPGTMIHIDLADLASPLWLSGCQATREELNMATTSSPSKKSQCTQRQMLILCNT